MQVQVVMVLLLLCLQLMRAVSLCSAHVNLLAEDCKEQTLYSNLPVYHRRSLLSIGVLSDIQYRAKNQNLHRYYALSLQKVEHAVNEMNANHSHLDLVMHLGDTVDGDLVRHLGVIDAHLKRLQFPFYQILGNHDFFELKKSEPHQVHRLLGMPARYYSLRAGEDQSFLIIVLDATELSLYATVAKSSRRKETEAMMHRYRGQTKLKSFNGGIGVRQMQWLRRQLDYATQEKLSVMIFSHMPMYPFDTPLNLWNDVEIVGLISNYPSILAVVSGHKHDWGYRNKEFSHGGTNFTIHFISFGGIVQSPYTSWGFIDVYEGWLHAHGLRFGCAIDYRLKINLTLQKSPSSALAADQRLVKVVSHCTDGEDTSFKTRRMENIPAPYSSDVTDITLIISEGLTILYAFAIILFLVSFCLQQMKRRLARGRRDSAMSPGCSAPVEEVI